MGGTGAQLMLVESCEPTHCSLGSNGEMESGQLVAWPHSCCGDLSQMAGPLPTFLRSRLSGTKYGCAAYGRQGILQRKI